MYDADQPQRGAPIGAGDDQAKYASDHSGGHKEGDGGDDSDADVQLDEKIDSSDDHLHMCAADLAEKLIAVLSPHPERWWFFVPMHALISDASLCQQVLARVAKGIAVHRGVERLARSKCLK